MVTNKSSSGLAKTEIRAVLAPQVNFSSAGDTYTDALGDTYAETTNQTRMTLNATWYRQSSMVLSGHVSAGTGTFQYYNFTDSASLGTATTSSVTEAVIAVTTLSQNDGNNKLGKVVTIRVKNSGVGGAVTIDSGGMVEYDQGGGAFVLNVEKVTTVFINQGSFVSAMSVAVVRRLTTDTFALQMYDQAGLSALGNGNAVRKNSPIGAAITNADHGTVVARNPTYLANAAVFLLTATTGTVPLLYIGVDANWIS